MCGSPRKPPILVTFSVDPDEMARRGRLSGLATRARHDSAVLIASAREAFEARFRTDDERREYFAELGRKSGEARRARRLAQNGGAS